MASLAIGVETVQPPTSMHEEMHSGVDSESVADRLARPGLNHSTFPEETPLPMD